MIGIPAINYIVGASLMFWKARIFIMMGSITIVGEPDAGVAVRVRCVRRATVW